MKLHTIADVETALRPYYEVAHQMTGKGITVERMHRLMAHLGHPERQLKVVHVAGTSGKTSTTYYLATLLQAAGRRVGHTVSPHVDSLTERVQINGYSLGEQQFCARMTEFLQQVQSAPEVPSWFECMTAFALWIFAQERVDYAVLETGLGGLHDASNVCQQPDKVCVITDIGYDHMHILGNSLREIALQKAGIVHAGNTLLMYEQDDEIVSAVQDWVLQQANAELFLFDQQDMMVALHQEFNATLAKYQQRNWILAYATYLYLTQRDNLQVLSTAAVQHTQNIIIPGRMDVRHIQGKTILMDGAHNAQKMTALVQSFQAIHGSVKVPVLIALKNGKEINDIAPILAPIASEVIVTTFTSNQGLPFICQPPKKVAQILQNYIANVGIEPNPIAAYRQFLVATQTVGLITGSFYLLSELREALDLKGVTHYNR
jgi:dihydrofolate synthase/folylpolyglutamate synthase